MFHKASLTVVAAKTQSQKDWSRKSSVMGGREARADTPLPAAARAECAPCHPGLMHCFDPEMA
jgi:hypothetical protein